MTVNPFFKNYNLNGDNTNEQDLIKNLFAEAVQIVGIDIHYLPRKNDGQEDLVFGEDILTHFDEKFTIETFIASVEGFDGPEREAMGPMGWLVKDQLELHFATKRWSEVFASTNYPRPREGDLIFFPLTNTLFEIKFTEDEKQFYPRGTLPTWKCSCEIFDYGQEEFDVGIPEIDNLDVDVDLSDETVFDNRHPDAQAIEDVSDTFVDPEGDNDIWGGF